MSRSNDFSLFALFTAGLAFAPAVSALTGYTQPQGSSPSGNPISLPGLHNFVPVGTPYAITWEPTTHDCESVDLVLLKGPSTNAVAYSVIALDVANSGSYSWTPSTSFPPGNADGTGYGIQLICDKTGVYQYSTQFALSNPTYHSSSSSSAAPHSSSHSAPAPDTSSSLSSYHSTAAPHSSSSSAASGYAATTTAVVTDYTTYCPEATTFTVGSSTYSVSSATTLTIPYSSATGLSHHNSTTLATSTAVVVSPYSSAVVTASASGVVSPSANGTLVTPTAPNTASASGATGTSASASGPATQTANAATQFGVNAGAMFAAAGLAFFAL